MRIPAFLRRHARWHLALVTIAVLVTSWFVLRPAEAEDNALTVTAKRGPLDINVLVGGSLEALESQELLCEVSGEQVKILRIVEEGYLVTPADVDAHKVLVELDSSKLKQNLVNQEVTFQSTQAALIEAQQSYEIQVNQNKTDIKGAELKVRFKLMDLEKYIGAGITADVVTKLGLREEWLMSTATTTSVDERPVRIDFTQSLKNGLIEDGTAKQELRKREDELLLAKTTLSQNETKLSWSERLAQKGFLTKSELETDQNAAAQARLRADAAATEVDLFARYEFPKMAEESLSAYEDALQALIRARKEAISRLAQADAKLKAAQAHHELEKQKLDELAQQIKNCQLCAKTPGMVVYGGGSDRNFWNQERIAVGAQVYERQPIITIPDQTKMGVNVGVHESHIMKVKVGQRVVLTADAAPDDPLYGEVVKVAVLPDSQNRWMNPDMKLYPTRIAIEGKRDWMKPGMSAKIEIHTKRLDDVIFLPQQAVTSRDGKPVVFRPGTPPQRVDVEVGEANDEFIEIKSGLAAGEIVLLRVPENETPDTGDRSRVEPTKDVELASRTPSQ